MRVLESWVAEPLERFLDESAARLVLVMTSSGQVVAQHGFIRSLDVMSAAALGAGILASTGELAKLIGTSAFGALVHQGSEHGLYLYGFDTPRGRWIGLVVFGAETSVGLVQLFFQQFITEIVAAAPPEAPRGPVLAENFEHELDSSLRALFGR
ncbi:MAG: roadblock/LC7 domain-containing protein [Gemmatimonadales bacterium]|nr:roadblock/LC7 domain-containing protein [Gemmatimonadales bacterium]